MPKTAPIYVQFTCMTRDQVFPVVLLKYTGTKGGDRTKREVMVMAAEKMSGLKSALNGLMAMASLVVMEEAKNKMNTE